MVSELPKDCDTGTKLNTKGYKTTWNGYKLHTDVIARGITVSALLIFAFLHDSQVAIPLAKMTAQRVTNLYDLMDSAYACSSIRDYS